MVYGEILTNSRLLRFTNSPIKLERKLQIKPVAKFKKKGGIEKRKKFEEVLGKPQDRQEIIFRELQESSSSFNLTWNNQ